MSTTTMGPGSSIRPVRVLVIAGTILLATIVAMAWPLVVHHLHDRQVQRTFQLASDPVQADIVRTYLEHESKRPPRVDFDQELYFDRTSAALCSIDHPAPCDDYEFLSAARDGHLVDWADVTIPVALRRLLDRATLLRTHNEDPHVPGVPTVETSAGNPIAKACIGWQTSRRQPRLVRISRAAVHAPSGVAIALVLSRYCDDSGGMRVIEFRRQEGRWVVVEDQG